MEFICIYCGRVYQYYWHFKRHIRKHVKPPYTCPICRIDLGDKMRLLRHSLRNGDRMHLLLYLGASRRSNIINEILAMLRTR